MEEAIICLALFYQLFLKGTANQIQAIPTKIVVVTKLYKYWNPIIYLTSRLQIFYIFRKQAQPIASWVLPTPLLYQT